MTLRDFLPGIALVLLLMLVLGLFVGGLEAVAAGTGGGGALMLAFWILDTDWEARDFRADLDRARETRHLDWIQKI